jgi:hypothetical protein
MTLELECCLLFPILASHADLQTMQLTPFFSRVVMMQPIFAIAIVTATATATAAATVQLHFVLSNCDCDYDCDCDCDLHFV